MPRIAFIEDEPAFHEALKQFLQTLEGVEFVGSFFSAEDALVAVPSKLQPDVMLVDINLPGQSGIEAVRVLHERCAALEMMMLTTREESEYVFDALKAGATGYIIKNTSLADIGEHIRMLLAGGAPMSAAVSRQVLRYFQGRSPQTVPQQTVSQQTVSQASLEPELLTQTAEVLSERERDVLRLLSKGYRHKDIAVKLFISPETVRVHIKRIYEKLHVHSRSELLEKLSS
jgi:DNA-binding NarL/FixJ family response regulator